MAWVAKSRNGSQWLHVEDDGSWTADSKTTAAIYADEAISPDAVYPFLLVEIAYTPTGPADPVALMVRAATIIPAVEFTGEVPKLPEDLVAEYDAYASGSFVI